MYKLLVVMIIFSDELICPTSAGFMRAQHRTYVIRASVVVSLSGQVYLFSLWPGWTSCFMFVCKTLRLMTCPLY